MDPFDIVFGKDNDENFVIKPKVPVFFVLLWIMSMVVSLSLLGFAVYAIVHFVAKFW